VAVSRLTVAPDPALAVVVRIFVGAVSERLEVAATSRDDLRLAASELFAAAVEAGGGENVSLTIEREDDVIALSAALTDPAAANGADRETWQGRLDLIRALFPDAEVGPSVRIAVRAGSGPATG
jgi:hypothetical protein